jgi:adenylosuccinate synthase
MAHGKCTIVVGGQYGSEGKGKVVTLLTQQGTPLVVRCGGPNSGHTTNVEGRDVVVRQIPCGVGNPNATLLVAAGCVVDEALLVREAEHLGVSRDRLVVDPRAVLLEEADRRSETESVFRIGSTGSGTGSALARRMIRGTNVRLARDSELVRDRARIESVAPLLHDHLNSGGEVVVEGTQGFGLSLLHGPDYPFATSRDTTAAAFCSEVGLSPLAITAVVLVARTYPIRVGGNSGPMHGELSWDEVQRRSGAPQLFPEYTSVTKRLRRVGVFDPELLKGAAQYNQPTAIAIMGLDRLDYSNSGAHTREELSSTATEFIAQVETSLRVPVEWVGTGFGTFDAIDLRNGGFSRSVPAAAARA